MDQPVGLPARLRVRLLGGHPGLPEPDHAAGLSASRATLSGQVGIKFRAGAGGDDVLGDWWPVPAVQRLPFRSGLSNRPDSKQTILCADHLGMLSANLHPLVIQFLASRVE